MFTAFYLLYTLIEMSHTQVYIVDNFSLGINHDDSAECPKGKNIMASSASVGSDVLIWSSCSARQLKTSLE